MPQDVYEGEGGRGCICHENKYIQTTMETTAKTTAECVKKAAPLSTLGTVVFELFQRKTEKTNKQTYRRQPSSRLVTDRPLSWAASGAAGRPFSPSPSPVQRPCASVLLLFPPASCCQHARYVFVIFNGLFEVFFVPLHTVAHRNVGHEVLFCQKSRMAQDCHLSLTSLIWEFEKLSREKDPFRLQKQIYIFQ